MDVGVFVGSQPYVSRIFNQRAQDIEIHSLHLAISCRSWSAPFSSRRT